MASPDPDAALQKLASRHPLFFDDLSQLLSDQGRRVAVEVQEGDAALASSGRNRFLFNCSHPQQATELLGQLPGETRLVQMFHSTAQFLAFVTRSGALDCIQHQLWWPWLMTPREEMQHVQHWLATEEPRNWPWFLEREV
ncbi:MAG: hypothetical protein V3T77_00525, partial [Planctomycetota bacterium]